MKTPKGRLPPEWVYACGGWGVVVVEEVVEVVQEVVEEVVEVEGEEKE